MRFLSRLLAAVAVALPLAALADDARVIVRFKAQADSVRAKALAARATALDARQIAQTRGSALGLRHGQLLSAGLSLDERTHVFTAQGLSSAALARQLAADPEVELVAVDHRRRIAARLPNDTLFGSATINPESANPDGSVARTIDQWYLKKPESADAVRSSGAAISSINAPDAWAISTGSASTLVAVIDTGVRPDHPDLSGKFVGGYDFIGYGEAGNSIALATANDGDYADADASDPGDWVSQSDIDKKLLGSGCTSADIGASSWHGTRVSGLIAANTDNGLGMAGVAWGARVMPIRVLGKCGGYDSDIMAGMKWAAGLAVPGVPANANKAKVLNLSLGGDGSCEPPDSTALLYRSTINAVNAAGAIVVVAAGNTSLGVGLPGNCPGVITVGALRHVGTKVGFASLGPEVTLSAPGGNCINIGANQPCLYPMVSTTNSGSQGPVAADNAYTGSSPSVGTSFSTPIVSGVIALMASVRPSLSFADVKGILQSTARAFPSTGSTSATKPPVCTTDTSAVQDECYCTTTTCGAGMLDAAAAVAAVQALNGATVTIAATPASGLTAGSTLSLTASVSGLAAGRSIVGYAWTVTDAGGGVVSGFASGASTATATITPAIAGSFSVMVVLTDDLGQTYSQNLTTSVAAAPVVTPTPTPTPSSGGGGGASSPLWLALLLLAALALPRRSAARA